MVVSSQFQQLYGRFLEAASSVPARRAGGFFDQYARTRAREGLYAKPDYRTQTGAPFWSAARGGTQQYPRCDSERSARAPEITGKEQREG